MMRARWSRLDGRRVLLVDGNADHRHLVKAMLETYGAVVTTALTPSEGLERFDDVKPEIVISEVAPSDSPRALLQRAKAAGLPAVALTTRGTPRERAEATAAGFDVHLLKPIVPFDLCTEVASLLEMRTAA